MSAEFVRDPSNSSGILQESTSPLDSLGRAKGVWAPALTPLDVDLMPDLDKALAYYRWLLEAGCHGLALMGTNSEATSFSVRERKALLDKVLEAGISPERLMIGSGCASIMDSVELTKHATAAGCSVLTLPPFYYKDISDEGLYASYAEIIERVGSSDLRLNFYHFPKLSMVPITHEVIQRLLKAYPGVIKGLKDSTGNAESCAAYIREFPELAIFPGSEALLLEMLKIGGVGTITAGANVFPGLIRRVYDAFTNGDEEAALKADGPVQALRQTIQKHPMIPALKAVMAIKKDDPAWRRVRPPLAALDDAGSINVITELEAAGL